MDPNNILHISTFPPRECGIATFTQDLIEAFNKKFNPVTRAQVCALNELPTSIYNYNNNVVNQIAATELENYVSLAKKINSSKNIGLINIQHEFGIFGGKSGDYVIPFLQALEKPAVVTLHSVLLNPDETMRKVMEKITKECGAVVVMNKLSQNILTKQYNIPQYKIYYIPHGIPQVTYEASKDYKKKLGLENKLVLSTFGLLSQNKGVQYIIRALPRVVKKFPDIVYLIIGETHPTVRERQGEKYRNFLQKEVEKLGLKNNVKFYNKYISLDEIVNFLKATDIYLSTPIDQNQSVSGTLSYALGVGRPVISTKTQYADYIINKNNGILVDFRNPNQISRAVIKLLSDEKCLKSMGARAYKDTRKMIWPNVAEMYFKLYQRLIKIREEKNKLPEIKFDHIVRLTDDFGIIQHARYSKPDKRFGYSLDDIARALIVSAMYYKDNPSSAIEKLMHKYLSFIMFCQRKNGTFSNIVSSKKEKDRTTEEDVQGRTLWALGYTAAQDFLPKSITKQAKECFKRSQGLIDKMKAPRSVAFAINGLYFYLKVHPNKNLKRKLKSLADKLVDLYEENASYNWYWFEDCLTYSNSKMPEALFYSYDFLGNKKYLDIASSSLEFLDSVTFGPDYYSPIGQKGWYSKHKRRSYYDQQPEDTATMVQTKIAAYKITKNKKHLEDALKAFQWFLGKNHLGLMVYDELTGGCHDGLGQHELNLNEGAESSISYLMARLSLEDEEIKSFLSSQLT